MFSFSLSIDNLVVSTGIGLYQIQVIPFTAIVGITTFVVTLVGHDLGGSIRRYLAIGRTDMLSGIILVAIGISLAAIELE